MSGEFLNPRNIILNHLKCQKRMLAADFGCGSGGWSLPLAKMLNEGKIYAVDILEEPLSSLKSKARINNIVNVETIRADIEKPITKLLSNSLDIVLMTNLLFQTQKRKEILSEAKRVLKPGGQILVIDWKKEARVPDGAGEKVPPSQIKKIANELGFSIDEEFDAGDFHFGLVLRK